MLAGTGNVYPPFPVYTAPRILDYTQSAELDAQFFFSGTPWEMVGRNYTAQTLNLANGGNLTQYDVTSKPLFPECVVKAAVQSEDCHQSFSQGSPGRWSGAITPSRR